MMEDSLIDKDILDIKFAHRYENSVGPKFQQKPKLQKRLTNFVQRT